MSRCEVSVLKDLLNGRLDLILNRLLLAITASMRLRNHEIVGSRRFNGIFHDYKFGLLLDGGCWHRLLTNAEYLRGVSTWQLQIPEHGRRGILSVLVRLIHDEFLPCSDVKLSCSCVNLLRGVSFASKFIDIRCAACLLEPADGLLRGDECCVAQVERRRRQRLELGILIS